MKTAPHFRLGVTGGIGCGKSTAGTILKKLGWAVIDTDDVARQLVSEDQDIISAILTAWPEAASADGSVNRRRLGEIVFQQESERAQLNAIVHPRVREAWHAERQRHLENNTPSAVIIPLLHEVGAKPEFDLTLCIGCTPATQVQRLSQRGWSREHINARIASQLPLQEKIALSDLLVWNAGSRETLEKQILNFSEK